MQQSTTIWGLLTFCLFLLLISCSPSAPANPPTLPTETIIPSATTASTDAPVSVETPASTSTPAPAFERPHYVIDLQMNYGTKAAVVDQTITYPNWTGETLTNIVLAVVPNLWSGCFSLKAVSSDDLPVISYSIEDFSQRLEITLPRPLEPGRTAVIKINYGLLLPQMQAYNNSSNDVRPQIYGYSERQTNLVD